MAGIGAATKENPGRDGRGFLLRGSRLIRSVRTENKLARNLHSLSIGQSQAARGGVGLHDIDRVFFLIGP